MRDLLKRIARKLLGEYALYRIWRSGEFTRIPVDKCFELREVIKDELDPANLPNELADSLWYFGSQARGFGCFENGQLLGLAFFWWGKRYAQRNSWPIEPSAAKLVHIIVTPAARGRGLAPWLIQAATSTMQDSGHAPLYARVWHSNKPSQRAFRRAGWHPWGWLVQVQPLWCKHPWTLPIPRRL